MSSAVITLSSCLTSDVCWIPAGDWPVLTGTDLDDVSEVCGIWLLSSSVYRRDIIIIIIIIFWWYSILVIAYFIAILKIIWMAFYTWWVYVCVCACMSVYMHPCAYTRACFNMSVCINYHRHSISRRFLWRFLRRFLWFRFDFYSWNNFTIPLFCCNKPSLEQWMINVNN